MCFTCPGPTYDLITHGRVARGRTEHNTHIQIRLTLMRSALRVPSDGETGCKARVNTRVAARASGVEPRRAGSAPAPLPAGKSRGCGAAAELSTCPGESATRAVVTDSQCRRRPTVCPPLGRRALHRPAALRLPP